LISALPNSLLLLLSPGSSLVLIYTSLTKKKQPAHSPPDLKLLSSTSPPQLLSQASSFSFLNRCHSSCPSYHTQPEIDPPCISHAVVNGAPQ